MPRKAKPVELSSLAFDGDPQKGDVAFMKVALNSLIEAGKGEALREIAASLSLDDGSDVDAAKALIEQLARLNSSAKFAGRERAADALFKALRAASERPETAAKIVGKRRVGGSAGGEKDAKKSKKDGEHSAARSHTTRAGAKKDDDGGAGGGDDDIGDDGDDGIDGGSGGGGGPGDAGGDKRRGGAASDHDDDVALLGSSAASALQLEEVRNPPSFKQAEVDKFVSLVRALPGTDKIDEIVCPDAARKLTDRAASLVLAWLQSAHVRGGVPRSPYGINLDGLIAPTLKKLFILTATSPRALSFMSLLPEALGASGGAESTLYKAMEESVDRNRDLFIIAGAPRLFLSNLGPLLPRLSGANYEPLAVLSDAMQSHEDFRATVLVVVKHTRVLEQLALRTITAARSPAEGGIATAFARSVLPRMADTAEQLAKSAGAAFGDVMSFSLEIAAFTGKCLIRPNGVVRDALSRSTVLSSSCLPLNKVSSSRGVSFHTSTPARDASLKSALKSDGTITRTGGGARARDDSDDDAASAASAPARSTKPSQKAKEATLSPFRAGPKFASSVDELLQPAILRPGTPSDMRLFIFDKERPCVICNKACPTPDVARSHPQYAKLPILPPKAEAMELGTFLAETGGGDPSSEKGRAWDAAHAHLLGGKHRRGAGGGGAKGK